MKYLAYFQAYTNTYGELESLKRKYEEALAVDGVVGLVIGTRPDCMPDDLLRYLENLNKHTFLLVEYGIESTRDETLRRINRGHTFSSYCQCGGAYGCLRNTDRRTCNPGAAGRDSPQYRGTGEGPVAFTAHYAENASVAIDTRHPYGYGI